jgi:hypothetical protein
MAGRAAFVVRLGESLQQGGIEAGQVTNARHDLAEHFSKVVESKDEAVKSIL